MHEDAEANHLVSICSVLSHSASPSSHPSLGLGLGLGFTCTSGGIPVKVEGETRGEHSSWDRRRGGGGAGGGIMPTLGLCRPPLVVAAAAVNVQSQCAPSSSSPSTSVSRFLVGGLRATGSGRLRCSSARGVSSRRVWLLVAIEVPFAFLLLGSESLRARLCVRSGVLVGISGFSGCRWE